MYITTLIALAVSFAVTAAAGAFLVPFMKRIHAGQTIREDGPTWHMSKQGTPIMGGLMFITGCIVTCLAVGFKAISQGDLRHVMIVGFSLVFGAIGFSDDYLKLKKKQNMGLTASQKFLLQLAAAIVMVLLLRRAGYISGELLIPFSMSTVTVPWAVYLVFAAFVIVGTVNAVNLTDGVDGLVSGVSVPVMLAYWIIAVRRDCLSVGVSSAALAGGLGAFLLYNFHPAKIFMGDTGSLFLGGMVCMTAFALDMPLILVLCGIVYICETLSDIIQVLYFKATHGKRIFKMAPLHHHFEMCGWNEYKVFTIFTLVSAVFCAIAVIAVK